MSFWNRSAWADPDALECVPIACHLTTAPQSGRAPCPVCRGKLLIHQPDTTQPDRLLGTCAECKGWFLIDVDVSQMLLLPDSPSLACS